MHFTQGLVNSLDSLTKIGRFLTVFLLLKTAIAMNTNQAYFHDQEISHKNKKDLSGNAT